MLRTWMTRLLLLATFPVLGATDGCGTELLDNNGFELWCGDTLCTWQVEAGTVRKTPTWHDGDVGIELVGDSVALTQTSDVSELGVACVEVELLADVERNGLLVVEVDFGDDGVSELVQPVPTSTWVSYSYEVCDDSGTAQTIRFRVKKTAPGRAILGQIHARGY